MKKRGLFLLTVLSLVLSGLWMARAGWFAPCRAAARAARAAQARNPARTFDPMNTQAAWRYRHGQASNWRTVAIYR
jgi:hypothetical protein